MTTDNLTIEQGALTPEHAPIVEPDTAPDTPDDWQPIIVETGMSATDNAILRVIARNANSRHWTIAELADRAGIDRDLTRRLFDGNVKVSTDDVDNFARAFEMDFIDIMLAAQKELDALRKEAEDTRLTRVAGHIAQQLLHDCANAVRDEATKLTVSLPTLDWNPIEERGASPEDLAGAITTIADDAATIDTERDVTDAAKALGISLAPTAEPEPAGSMTPAQIGRAMRSKYAGMDETSYRRRVIELLTALANSVDPDGKNGAL